MAYLNPIKPVFSKYGAPMGRYTGSAYLDSNAGRVYLRQVRLDSGGYDRGGAYWGFGQPLYCAQDQDGNTVILRASCRDAAKRALRADYGDEMRFYR